MVVSLKVVPFTIICVTLTNVLAMYALVVNVLLNIMSHCWLLFTTIELVRGVGVGVGAGVCVGVGVGVGVGAGVCVGVGVGDGVASPVGIGSDEGIVVVTVIYLMAWYGATPEVVIEPAACFIFINKRFVKPEKLVLLSLAATMIFTV